MNVLRLGGGFEADRGHPGRRGDDGARAETTADEKLPA
jgi:hypothetical protein